MNSATPFYALVGEQADNDLLLQKAGLVETVNCQPFLAANRANKASKVDLELHPAAAWDFPVPPSRDQSRVWQLRQVRTSVAVNEGSVAVAGKTGELARIENFCREKREKKEAITNFALIYSNTAN